MRLPEPLQNIKPIPAVRSLWGEGSGPVVARLFLKLMALIFLIAFWSFLSQADTLISSRGLLPADTMVQKLTASGFWERPSVFHWQPEATWLNGSLWSFLPSESWWTPLDAQIHLVCWMGMLLSLAALFGLWPQLCMLCCTLLYLSLCSVTDTFTGFQWDNMILECGILAVFLPTNRKAWWIHWLFRIVLFKLYWESGIAKSQSHLGDWDDGSAMLFYYETAPIPTWLAWYAHNLPDWWHNFETHASMVLELLVAQFILGPRFLKLIAFLGFTGFQVIDISTANYGFFCYLSLALHVFLLEDRDILWIYEKLRLKKLITGFNSLGTSFKSWRPLLRAFRARISYALFFLLGVFFWNSLGATGFGAIGLSALTTLTLIAWKHQRIPKGILITSRFVVAALVCVMVLGISTIEGLASFSTIPDSYHIPDNRKDAVKSLIRPYEEGRPITIQGAHGLLESIDVNDDEIKIEVKAADGAKGRLTLVHPTQIEDTPHRSRSFAMIPEPATRLEPAGALVGELMQKIRHNDRRGQFWLGRIQQLRQHYRPYRLIHSYHLFGHITRDRIEPEVQVYDGRQWTPLEFKYKADNPERPPRFAAPHQPRVDFQLWFYGLRYLGYLGRYGDQARQHAYALQPYVQNMLKRLCTDPEIVAPLFATELPQEIQKVRINFWSHRFTTPEERAENDRWWRRTPLLDYLKSAHPQVAQQLKDAQPSPMICRAAQRSQR